MFLSRDSSKVLGWSDRQSKAVKGTEWKEVRGFIILKRWPLEWILSSLRPPGKQLPGSYLT